MFTEGREKRKQRRQDQLGKILKDDRKKNLREHNREEKKKGENKNLAVLPFVAFLSFSDFVCPHSWGDLFSGVPPNIRVPLGSGLYNKRRDTP